jgi:hypothetical protein
MQNKPNLPNTEMNATIFDKRDYENTSGFRVQKNKAKSKPISSAETPYSARQPRDCHPFDCSLDTARDMAQGRLPRNDYFE